MEVRVFLCDRTWSKLQLNIVCDSVYMCVCLYTLCDASRARLPTWNTKAHSHSFISRSNQIQFAASPSPRPAEAALALPRFRHTILCIYRHKSRVWTCIWVRRARVAPVISRESESASRHGTRRAPGHSSILQLLIQTLISPRQTLAQSAQCRPWLVRQTDQ